MCGIAGYLKLNDVPTSEHFEDWFLRQCGKVLVRGPDAMGLVGAIAPDYAPARLHFAFDCRKMNHRERIVRLADLLFLARQQTIVSLNFRGIPTTEQYGRDVLTREEIQPFSVDGITVAHNGLLSNDRALSEQHGSPRLSTAGDHDIDTYAFIHAWMRDPDGPMSEIEGSWALALFDHARGLLRFARTFLGLHLAILRTHRDGACYFAWSSEPFDAVPQLPDVEQYFTWELPAYSRVTIDVHHLRKATEPAFTQQRLALAAAQIQEAAVFTRFERNSKVAVVLSGGLDSTTAATMACIHYEEVHLIHFRYGARAEGPEVRAVRDVHSYLSKRFKARAPRLEFIDLDYLTKLGGSTLTDHSLEVAKGEEGVETAHEWVPARNLVMAALTAAYCDRRDIGTIMLGTNREESAVFPDNSSEFHRALSRTLELCTNARPEVFCPLENMMKAHIYRTALEIKAPIHLSWSCYHGGNQHCGTCGPCYLRKTAALMCHVEDNITYAE